MIQRTQITLDQTLDQRAKERARQLGVSFAEYIRRLISEDLGESKQNIPLVDLIGLGDSGGSDVAAHEEVYLDQAFGGQ